MILTPMHGRSSDRGFLAAVLALLVVSVGYGAGAQFSSSVDLVEVYVSVTSTDGRPVDTLTAEDFVVTEDGTPRAIDTFAQGDFPLSVVLALDRSFSMAGPPLRQARDAARSFLDGLRPEDEALVVAIGTGVEPQGEISRDRSQQRAAVDALVPWGTTSLHDAIKALLEQVGSATGRRAVIVFSDGRDRYSTATVDDVVMRARQTDVLFYGIALGEARSALFEELASLTGGQAHHIVRPEQLAGVLNGIQRELRTQYLLGYQPVPDGPSGWRTIVVSARRPDVRVRARGGYLAP
ncbi:MAG: VWA domain-containing protein [Vicinamibacterales bacterium]